MATLDAPIDEVAHIGEQADGYFGECLVWHRPYSAAGCSSTAARLRPLPLTKP
jgi:hypothetical protein